MRTDIEVTREIAVRREIEVRNDSRVGMGFTGSSTIEIGRNNERKQEIRVE